MEAYCVNLERLSVQAHWTAGVVSSCRSDTVIGHNDHELIATPGLADVISSLGGHGGHGEDEYIVEAFLEDDDKLEALVKTLLALEFWRENVLFARKRQTDNNIGNNEKEEVDFEIEGGEREETDQYNDLNEVDGGDADDLVAFWLARSIEEADNVNAKEPKGLAYRLAANGNALRTAFVLHVETTIVSLLNLIFYKGIPAGLLEGSGDDVLLSLVDYCARQLIFLGSPEESNPALSRQKNPLPTSQLSNYLQERSRIDEIQDSIYDSTYQTAIASVALSRYLCESLDDLGPSLLSRVLEVHDFPLLMVPLMEEPPWTRRREGKGKQMIWEKLDDHNEWSEVPPTDLLRLTKLEGQPWLALFHLTTSKVCRESYGLDEYRKSQLMRLRRYIHEALTDQLPVLGDVARYLDELSIVGVPASGQGVHRPSSAASSSGLLLQRVDSLRESIVGKRNMHNDDYWEGLVQTQWEEIFSHVTDSKDDELRRIASEVYGGSGMDDAMGISASDHASTFEGKNGLHKDIHRPTSMAEASNAPIEGEWKLALSKSVQKVTLHLEDGSTNSALGTFELVPVHNGADATTTETPLGPFRRLKMSISQTSGDGEAVFPRAKAIARVQFQKDASSDDSNEVILSIDSLELPTTDPDTSPNSYDGVGIVLPANFPSKEWRQLGDVQGKNVVLQLGFKRLPCGVVPAGSTLLRGYALSQAFLSQPVVAA